MSRQVVLIGTSHVYQWGGCWAPIEVVANFLALLEEVRQNYSVGAIAEEMSIDSLRLHDRHASTIADWCKRVGLVHCYCDPSEREQEELGIRNDGVVRYLQQVEGFGDDEAERLIRVEYDKREAQWLARLQELNAWPVIFVCGSSHVTSFSQLLSQNDFQVVVKAANWGAIP